MRNLLNVDIPDPAVAGSHLPQKSRTFIIRPIVYHNNLKFRVRLPNQARQEHPKVEFFISGAYNHRYGATISTSLPPNRKRPRQYQNADDLYRSEEHTSELQSRENLVCRLLPEKKKKQQNIH